MSYILDKVKHIKKIQVTVDNLLDAGDVKLRNGDNTGWTLTPLFTDNKCDIGFVDIDKVEAGRCPDHVHDGSVEYLIVLSGEILFNVDGRDLRIIKAGDVGVIPAGVPHHSKPLVDDTKMVYVCVPRDPGMEVLTQRINNVK